MSIMYFSSQVEQVKNTFKNLSKKVWKVGLEMSKSPWLTSKYHLTRAKWKQNNNKLSKSYLSCYYPELTVCWNPNAPKFSLKS